MRKRVLSIAISVLMVTVIIASGCTKKEDGKMEVSPIPVTGSELQFWTMQLSSQYDKQLKSSIAKFENENKNIKIKWVDIPFAEMERKIIEAAASDGMPDIANLESGIAFKLANSKAILDIDSVASDVKPYYFECAYNNVKYNEKVYALPWLMETDVTYYNKELLSKAGVNTEKAPKNYEELYNIGKKVKEKTGKYGYMPLLSQQSGMEEFEKMGIRLFNDEYTKANFTSKQVINGANFYKKMLDEGIIPKESLTEGIGKAILLFCAGEVAIIQGNLGIASMIENNSQDIYKTTGVGKQITNNGGRINGTITNIVISQKSKYRDAAVKFAKYITNNVNQLGMANVTETLVPSTKEVLNDDYFTKAGESIKEIVRKTSLEQAEVAKEMSPPILKVEKIYRPFNNSLVKIVSGSAKIDEALKEAEESVNTGLENKKSE